MHPFRYSPSWRQMIVSVYTIAFGKDRGRDQFENAFVTWPQFIAPFVIVVLIGVALSFVDTPLGSEIKSMPWPRAALVLAIIAVGPMLRFSVAAATVWGIARWFAKGERLGVGVLAYLWLQTALFQPWGYVIRTGVKPQDPWWMIIAFGFVPAVALLMISGRVLTSALRLGHLGWGLMMFIAAAGAGWLADFLYGKLL